MSGCWRPPITRTESSTAQLIIPKTSKLCCFLSDLLHVEIDFLEFFCAFVLGNFATLPTDNLFAGAGVIFANMGESLCHLVR